MAKLRLASEAEGDIETALAFSLQTFGAAAHRRYEVLISTALKDIAADPNRAGSVNRAEFGPGVRSFHLSISRKRAAKLAGAVRAPRHVLFYRQLEGEIVEVIRMLYDAMDFARHLPHGGD